ncbi:vacuolar segregation protein PEP7-like [Lytechinus variegatus]|uniref:vacuolar segregation protein PEP7-like n=1 Tax=Lytechinus variegatus TaxID=7654 RepID=UPI001BB2660C|nr:vacuolar segregation protein PEP7-like [Lytechinus variegatus]
MFNNNKTSNPRSLSQAPPTCTASGDGRRRWQLGRVTRGQKRSSNLGPEVKQEWDRVQDDLKRFQQSFDAGVQNLEEQTDAKSAVTRSHWVPNAECSNCSNKSCKRPLWAMSKHHCRKCGLIFCAKCLQFKRRLSSNAEYDPNGWMCKVCEKCYDAKEQEIGHSRRWTYDLQLFRAARQKRDSSKLTRSVIERVCRNLVEGFHTHHSSNISTPQTAGPSPETNGGGSPTKNPFSFFKRSVSKVVSHGVPDWQKPPGWVAEGTSCQCCNRPYGKLEGKPNCRICGRLVCKPQSSRDLLLYTPDKSDRAELGSDPRWAIIRVIGSPEVEPDDCLYIRVCHSCKEQLTAIQVEDYQRVTEEGGMTYICLQQLAEIYSDIIKVQTKIDASLPEFQKLIDGLEIQAGAPTSLPPNRNNMQLLAKHQGDLSDHLSLFVITVGRLKRLEPQSRLQVKLVKNLMSCKLSFYQETNSLYRQLKKQLGEITPQEVLQEIQTIVDEKAINSACLSLNQLAFEVLHLCLKHNLEQSLPLTIKQAAEVCESDLKKKMESSGEDWEEHKNQINAFVKIQIKGDEENHFKPRLYIRPSRRRTKREGVLYVEWFVNQRTSEVAEKIHAQLVSRTADRSFKRTKSSLEELRSSFIDEDKNDDKNGWTLL